MSYKIKTIPTFDKNIKRLAKKYPSLKAEYLGLVQSLKEQPDQGTPLGNIVLKSAFLLHPKEKENQEVQG